MDFTKIKNFCASKETTKSEKYNPHNGRCLQIMCQTRDQHPDCIKNLQFNNPTQKRTKDTNRHFFKDIQMANKHENTTNHYGNAN